MWYKSGTVTVTNNSNIVTGVSTYWTNQVRVGDIFTVDFTTLYEISSVDSNTQITIDRVYEGSTAPGSEYRVIRNFTGTTNADIASNLTTLLSSWQVREDELRTWMAGTVNGGPNSDGFYPLTDSVGNTYLVGCPAYIESLAAMSMEWAITAEDVVVDPTNYPGEYSAKHHAAKAAASATDADTSATNSANSAIDSANSAINSSSSANTAIAKAADASTSASNAATSASNANTSASNAATSETNAATSESNAATSETNAAASETKAQLWAEENQGVEVEPGAYSAKHWATTAIALYHEHTNKSQLDLITDGDHDVRTDNPHGVTIAQIGAASSTHNHTGTYEPADSAIQTHITAAHAPSDAQKNSDIIKSEVEAVLTGNISSHTHSYLPTGGGTVSGDLFVSGLAKGGFPFAPNMIRNSYMSILDGTEPRGFSKYGTSYLIVEATSPLAKGFEGRYLPTSYYDANPELFVATPDLAVDETSSYWYGNYNKGPRIQRGGLYDGWGSYNGGRILKVTNNPAVTWEGYDTTSYHAAVTLPIDSNALGARWLFTCWVHIAKGECFGVGADAGYKCRITPPNLVSKATTDAGPQGWYRYSAMVSSSQITKLEALAMSMGFIPDSNGDLEVYLALPYLQNLMYQGTNLDAWVGSLSDTLYRGGFLFDFQSKTLKIGGDTMNGTPATESLEVEGNIVATGGDSTDWNVAYTHSQTAHAPSDAQKNSDILKAEIEAVLTGVISTHSHDADHTHSNKAVLDGIASGDITNWDLAYTHSQSAHAPSDAQKNSDILKSEIEAVLTGTISSHTHAADHTHANKTTLDAIAAADLTNWDTAYTHSQSAHAPSNAQANADILKSEIEAVLTGTISSHTHAADHTHANKTVLDGILAADVTAWDTAYTHSQAAHAPSDAQKNSDITKLEIEAVLIGEISSHTHAADHSHTNKTVLDGIIAGDITNWDTAYTHSQSAHAPSNAQANADILKSEIEAVLIGTISSHTHAADHTHTNKTVLDGIVAGDITNWDAAYTHSQAAHAPSNAQANADILKSEIEAVLTGAITSHTHSYLPLTGGTLSGSLALGNSATIKLTYGGFEKDAIKSSGGDTNGISVEIGAGARTVVGSGESAAQVVSNTVGTSETLYLSSDSDIQIDVDLQNGWASRKTITIDTSANISTPGKITMKAAFEVDYNSTTESLDFNFVG